MTAASKPLPGIDAFHRDRSKCVDAFADLEQAIIAVLKVAGVKTGTEAFSQKLSKLAKLSPSPRLSKAKCARLQQIAKDCEMVGVLRNDIVHSHMQLAAIGEKHKACFINHGHEQGAGQTARLFELGDLRELNASILKIASEVLALLPNPASSPLPPSRVAASGP